MNPPEVAARRTLRRLRTFLYLLAIGLFAGTIAELLMAEHYADRLQLVPFGLCGLGVVALIAAWRRSHPVVVLATRVILAAIAAGSLLGVYEHIQGNLEFAREVRPHAGMWELTQEVLTGGAPPLAPGVLVVGALVGIAATLAAQHAAERRAAAEEVPIAEYGAYSGRQPSS